MLALMSAMVFQACSDVQYHDTPSMAAASNLKSETNGRMVVLTWNLPSAAGIDGVQVLRNGDIIATLPADATTYTIKRETPGEDVAYTVKVIYKDGKVSEGITVFCDVVSTEKVAMVLPCPFDQLTDDDEIAAAEWFKNTYVDNGVILTTDELASLTPVNNPVVWIMVDRIGLQQGWRNLPAELVSDATIAALKGYVEAGGNIFLAKHATQLTVPLGYLADNYAPGIFGSGEGGVGTDIWAINCNICLKYDHRNQEIFRGLTTCSQFEWETYALEGPGLREDHNCMWDFNAFTYTAEGEDKVQKFQNQNNCTVLATWGHVVDDAVGGIIDFNPADGRGRCIANGLSAYEFHEEGGNEFHANIERLTRNTIDYLNK